MRIYLGDTAEVSAVNAVTRDENSFVKPWHTIEWKTLSRYVNFLFDFLMFWLNSFPAILDDPGLQNCNFMKNQSFLSMLCVNTTG